MNNNACFLTMSAKGNHLSNSIGNKALNTQIMHEHGIPVPKSIYLTAALHDLYLSNPAGFDEEIMKIQNAAKNEGLGDSIAVRSSAFMYDKETMQRFEEDGANKSMAGWFRSNVHVRIEKIKDTIIDCYDVAHSAVLQKNLQNNFPDKNLGISIPLVVQKFFHASKSAVIFTKNFYPLHKGLFLVNSAYGACHGIVSGEISGDNFWLDRENGNIVHKRISAKEKMYESEYADKDGLKEVVVDSRLQNLESLNDDDLACLHTMCMEVEKVFSFPQDIEAVFDNEWIIVQSRPINYWKN